LSKEAQARQDMFFTAGQCLFVFRGLVHGTSNRKLNTGGGASMIFKYDRQNLFVQEKTIISLFGSLIVYITLDLSKPAMLIGLGFGFFALAMELLLEYMAINYSEFSLYLHDNYLRVAFRDSEKDYSWTDLVSVQERGKGLYIKFHDGNMLSVLKEICDYEILRNMVASKVEIATH
jgi:hypothetical protein